MSGSFLGGVVGAAIGFFVGGPTGAYWGWTAGAIAGGLLFPEQIEGPRLQDLKVQSSEYGRPIPIVYGTFALGGNVIWASDLIEEASESGGKGGPEVTNYTYYANFAVAICEGGENIQLGRIWAGPEKRLIWDGANLEGADSGAQLRFYNGSESQLPDPLIESYMGAGNVPAYRGTAYVVLERFPVAKDGNRIPFLTVEVGKVEVNAAPEDLGWAAWIDQVIVWGDYYSIVYRATYRGIITRHQTDNTLYKHFVWNNEGEWTTGQEWFIDPDRGRMVRYTPEEMGFVVVDIATSARTDGTITVPVGADPNPGAWVRGACYHNGYYIFAAANSSARVTLYLVDPASLNTVYAYSGNLSNGGFRGPLIAPLDGSNEVYGFGRGSPNLLMALPITPNFTPVNFTGAPADMVSNVSGAPFVAARDPNTGYIWSICPSPRWDPDTLQVVVHDPVLRTRIYHLTVPVEFYQLAVGEPFTFIPGTPNKVMITVYRWLATDEFLVFDADTPALLSDIVGRSYGTAPINAVAYIPATDDLIAFRKTGWMNFAEKDAPQDLWFDPVTRKYIGEADANTDPDGQPLSEIVLDLSLRAGLTADQVDVTALTDIVDGYAIANQMDVRAAITALQPAYYFDGVEVGNQIKYVKRGGPIVVEIPDEDLGAYEAGTQPVDPLETVRQMDEELPANFNVRFILEATNYDAASRLAKRLVGNSGTEATLDLPIVMTEQKAQEVAEVNLHLPWIERLKYRFSLPRKYAYLTPTDIIGVKGYSMRIVSIKQTGGRYQVEAVHDDENVYTPNVVVTPTPPAGGGGGGGGGGVEEISPTVLEVISTNAFRDADASDPGYWVAAAAQNPEATWRGAVLFYSSDGGTNYTRLVDIPAESTMGYTNGALPAFLAGNIIDEISSVNVTLVHGTLSSTTNDGLLNGTNACVIGDEILCFRDATLESNGSYTLRGFLRYRRGTEFAQSSHAVAERFVLLSTATLVRIPADTSWIGVEKQYKAVSSGSSLANTEAKTFTSEGTGLMPYAPVHLGGGRDAEADIHLHWTRRGRIDASWRNLVDVPLGEASEAYVVRFYTDSTYATVARTVEMNSPFMVYDAAQQTADFGAPQSTVYFDVRQVSATVGPGHAARGSV